MGPPWYLYENLSSFWSSTTVCLCWPSLTIASLSVLATAVLLHRWTQPRCDCTKVPEMKGPLVSEDHGDTIQRDYLRHPSTTVIVGGGIIGVTNAYQMAVESLENNVPCRIIVVEISRSIFTAASSSCTGCLAYHWLDGDELRTLGEYCFGKWEELAIKNDSFRRESGYNKGSIQSVHPKEGDNSAELFSWVRSQKDSDVRLEPKDGHSASVNPVATGKWFYKKCKEMGVEFLTSTRVESVKSSDRGGIHSVQLINDKGHHRQVNCHNMILAAGPWTDELIAKLFVKSTVRLNPRLDSSYYIVVKYNAQPTEESVGTVILEPLVGHKLELAYRNDGTFWLCAYRDHTTPLPVAGKRAPPIDTKILKELKGFVKSYLKVPKNPCSPDSGPEYIDHGRSFRPITTRSLPIITEIPIEKLYGTNHKDEELGVRSGVFICSGHGMFGFSQAMGSAKLMAQIIAGTSTDIDVSSLGLP